MVHATSYRLTAELKERLAAQARVESTTETALVSRLLEQGLTAIDHPGIVFRPGPSGWRAGVAGGPDVDEIVRTVRITGETGESAVVAAAESLGVHPRLVRVAVAYASENLEEVERRMELQDEALAAARNAAEARRAITG